MISKLTAIKSNQKNESEHFNFKEKYEGIAGECPDCKSIVTYDCIFSKYVCLNPECEFQADISRRRIIRNKSVKQEIQTEQTL